MEEESPILPKTSERFPPVLIVPPPGVLSGTPSPKAQSWGTVISIIVIVLMIIIGAFYAWGQRIAEENALTAPAATSTQY